MLGVSTLIFAGADGLKMPLSEVRWFGRGFSVIE
jgi:hypothetical protein